VTSIKKIQNRQYFFRFGACCCLLLALALFVQAGLSREILLQVTASSEHDEWVLRWQNQLALGMVDIPKDPLPASIPGPADAWAGNRAHSIHLRVPLPSGNYIMEMQSYDAHESIPPYLIFALNGEIVSKVPIPAGDGRPGPYSQHNPRLTVRFAFSNPGPASVLTITSNEGSWIAPAKLRFLGKLRFKLDEIFQSAAQGAYQIFAMVLLVLLAVLFLNISRNRSESSLRSSAVLIISLMCGVCLFCIYSQFRENLVPHDASMPRSMLFLTGDEPSYLLIAQAIAAGDGLDVRGSHERNRHLAYWDRAILGESQFTWPWYRKLGMHSWIDRSAFWDDAQILPRPPLIPFMLASLAYLNAEEFRWNSILFLGLFTASMAAAVFFLMAHPTRRTYQVFQAIIVIMCMGAIPIAYYTTQISPEILVGGLLLLALALIAKDTVFCSTLAIFLLFLSLFGTQRVFLAVAMSTAVLFCLFLNRKQYALISMLACGWIAYFAFHFVVWGGAVIPNTNLNSSMDIRLLFFGTIRFFLSQDVGLFFLSPVSIAGLATGGYLLVKERAPVDWVWLALTTGCVLLVACFPDYRAGTCPAGRYQVITACLLAFPLLRLLGQSKRKPVPGLILFALVMGGVGMLISAYVKSHPNFWWRPYHPVFGHNFLQPYYDLLPNLTQPGWLSGVAIWVIIFAVFFILLAAIQRFIAKVSAKSPSPVFLAQG